MAIGQLFDLAPHTLRRARQATAHGTATPTRQVASAREMGQTGRFGRMGWRRVLGQNQESE
jgi:hypothetical protein